MATQSTWADVAKRQILQNLVSEVSPPDERLTKTDRAAKRSTTRKRGANEASSSLRSEACCSWSFRPRPTPCLGIGEKEYRGRRCDIAMQSSRQMNLHYWANGVERRRARERRATRENSARTYVQQTRGSGPVIARPCLGATSSRAHFATPRWSLERLFFSIPIIAAIARSRYGASRIGLYIRAGALAWEHRLPSPRVRQVDAFLRAFPHAGISARKLARMIWSTSRVLTRLPAKYVPRKEEPWIKRWCTLLSDELQNVSFWYSCLCC